jgi:trimeric autotransporter adhesin
VKRTRSIALMAAAALVIALSLQPFQAQAQNIISTIVGGGATPTAPLTADLPGPTSAVRDSAGNTYIAAPLSTNIFKLTTSGTLSVFAGQGYGGYNGEGVLASAVQLASPAAIAFDSKGNMFFADYGSSRVRRVDAVTGGVTTVAGSGVKCAHGYNPCGDGAAATSAQLNLPEAIALDSAGNIFIADASDNKIRRVDAVTKVITSVVGNGNACTNPTLACGDGAAATAAQLNFPEGIAVDAAGNLYVSDTLDHRVRIVSPAGTINPFAGNGGFCHNSTTTCGDGHAATLANLFKPQQVAVDGSGNVYIADTGDHKIRIVDTTGTINLFAGSGAQGFGGDAGAAASAALDLPVGVSVDGSGNVLIADSGNQRVRIVSGGVIQTLAGGGSGGDGGLAISALLAGPYTVTGDSAGNLYIADTGNNRIRELSGGVITTVAGTGSVGFSGDNGPATSAMLNGPTSVAVDGAGNIFFSDTGNLVVRRIDATTHNITTVAGNGSSCFPTTSACGDGAAATSANLTWPLTVAVDTNDNLYIADYFAFKIRKVSGATRIISTIAGTGTAGKAGDGGSATKANLDHPSSVAVDGAGNIFISDQYNNKIRKVDTTGTINTYMGNGKACLCGDGGPALNGSMWNPLEVVTDPSGNVFVGGGNDNVVQRINATTGIWGTVAGNALKPLVGGFAGDGGLAALATLANFGLWVDAQNNLYIADQGNNRIRTVHLTPTATLPTQPLNFGNVALNTASQPKPVKLSSTGGVDLNLTNISITGANASNFDQTNNCGILPALLGVDASCTTNVVFTPTFYGTAKASLTYTDNATNSPQNISLKGSGPDFSIVNSPTAITVTRGTSGSVTATLAPIAGFNQTISLTCTGAPAPTTCTPNPSSVTLNGVGNGTAQVTIAVSSSTAPGNYTLVVKGAYVPLQHSANITLTVK